MNRAIGLILVWLDGRTSRERRLLAVLGIILGATAIWLGVIAPAATWGDDARLRLKVAEEQALVARTLLARSPARAANAPMPPGGLEPLLIEAATGRGLTITTEMSADGGLAFRGSGLSTIEAFGWLSDVGNFPVLEIVSLSVVEGGASTVVMEGVVKSDG